MIFQINGSLFHISTYSLKNDPHFSQNSIREKQKSLFFSP